MDHNTSLQVVASFAIAAALIPVLVFVHELGHAVAARALGIRVEELVVGDSPDLTITAGNFRMQLGRKLGRGDTGGYVLLGDERISVADLVIVAGSGPAANVVAASVLFWLTVADWTSGVAETVLGLLAAQSALLAVANLLPDGEPGSATMTNGRLIQLARRYHDAPEQWRDPNEATSIPPPGGAPGSP